MVRNPSTRQEKAQRLIDEFYNNKFELLQDQLNECIRFDKLNQARDLSIVSRAGYLQGLYSFLRKYPKPIKKITKDDLVEYFGSLQDKSQNTQKLTKIYIRKFFQFVYDFDNGTYPDVVKWIETRTRERHQKIDKKIITIEEYNKLLSGCLTQRDRAIVSFLFNTGAGIGETINVKLKDLEFDKSGVEGVTRYRGET